MQCDAMRCGPHSPLPQMSHPEPGKYESDMAQVLSAVEGAIEGASKGDDCRDRASCSCSLSR